MNHHDKLPARQPTGAPSSGVLQRKCGCGRHSHGGGACGSCRKKRANTLRGTAVQSGPVNVVPAVVQEVLGSPGQPLDASARAFFEPRFGQDFSGVRVHTDARATESARAVGALAYTVGQHIAFDAGQYAPGTSAGRRLLAHELAHVTQQGAVAGTIRQVSQPADPLERQAEALAEAAMNGGDRALAARPARAGGVPRRLFRRIARRMMDCPANQRGASADPFADLTDRDGRAQRHAARVAKETKLEVDNLRAGLGRNLTAAVEVAFEARFGLPNAVGKGFLNRLTGQTRPSFEVALAEEMNIISRRYTLLARLFSQWMHYRCINGPSNFAGCAPPNCTEGEAWSCAGVGVIFLCPQFWDLTTFDPVHFADQQAQILIHEGSHIYWERVGDEALRGSGRNFRIAECYSAFLGDVIGFPQVRGVPCPAPPP